MRWCLVATAVALRTGKFQQSVSVLLKEGKICYKMAY